MSKRPLRPRIRDVELRALLDEMEQGGLVHAAVALIGRPRAIERLAVVGGTRRRAGRPVRTRDRFDLASLTKPFTATLALRLDREGLLPLGARLGEIWGDGVAPRLARRTLGSLLRHRAGLLAWTPLYQRFKAPEAVAEYLLSDEALGDGRERYSDLDYILWGLSAERALEKSYRNLLARWVLRPLALSGAKSSPGPRPSVVESTLGNAREVSLAAEEGRVVRVRLSEPAGTAQDGNARFLGGLAAHAGLFASALDLFELASEWLSPDKVLTPADVDQALAGGRRYALGWMRRTVTGSAGRALSPAAIGHVGSTGGSLWLDPERDRILVLLAHRASYDVDLKPFRRRFHSMAFD